MDGDEMNKRFATAKTSENTANHLSPTLEHKE